MEGYINENTPLAEGARLIFSLGIGALPVVKGKKLIGILTGHDILTKMYPTTQQIIEDFTHACDFENMENNLMNILNTPVDKIMNRKMITVTPQTTLMHAQSLMLLHRFSHLPIVNAQDELVGVVSQGDIFHELMKNQVPKLEKERYADFIVVNYDSMIDWDKRFAAEYPILSQIFKKESVKKIVDFDVWTGEYTIRLAKKGRYRMIDLHHNHLMIKLYQEKIKQLSASVRKRIYFMSSRFTNLSETINEKSDAAIFMDNSLPYIHIPLDKLFSEAASILRKNNPVLIIQLLNLEKIIHTKDRLLRFHIGKSKKTGFKERLSIEFFDKNQNGQFFHHLILFDSDGKNWMFKDTTAVPIKHITYADIEKNLRKTGFDKIISSGHQDEYSQLNFNHPFEPQKSGWLNVLAQKS